VRSLTLRSLSRLLRGGLLASPALDNAILLLCAATGDEAAEVGVTSVEILVEVAASKTGLEVLLGAGLDTLRGAAVVSSVTRLRVLSLFVEISIASESTLERCTKQLGAVCAEWESDDVLFKLTVLELLLRLSQTAPGFQLMIEKGTIISICAAMANDGLDGAMLGPGLMRATAQWARTAPERLPLLIESGLLQGIVTQLSSTPECANLAISAIGALMATETGLEAVLAKLPVANILIDGLQKPDFISKQHTLEAFALALGNKTGASKANAKNLQGLVQSTTGADILYHLIQQLRQPEEVVVERAWAAIAALSEHEWGVVACGTTPGFCEGLLDRGDNDTRLRSDA